MILKPIVEIRNELRSISPTLLWPSERDPFKKPHHHRPGATTTTDPAATSTPVFPEVTVDYAEHPQDYFANTDHLLEREGIDALAWYVSFHVDGPPWGIFIPMSSLIYLERRYLSPILLPSPAKWQLAFDLLREHELFHFATDHAVAQWELLLQRPYWVEFAKKREASGAYLEVEEKLANASLLRNLEPTWRRSIRRAVRKLMSNQPPGYRDGPTCIPDGLFFHGLTELISNYAPPCPVGHSLSLAPAFSGFSPFFPLLPDTLRDLCPVHIIHDEDDLGIPAIAVQFLTRIPEIRETERFLKSLSRLPISLKTRWQKKKAQLAIAIPRHPDFEKLKGQLSDLFSLRLNDNFRVHLRPRAGTGAWEAVAVGTHKDLGHD